MESRETATGHCDRGLKDPGRPLAGLFTVNWLVALIVATSFIVEAQVHPHSAGAGRWFANGESHTVDPFKLPTDRIELPHPMRSQPPLAGNFSANFYGQPDDREWTWGRHQSVDVPWVFPDVPPDMRVRLLSITGDLIVWPTNATVKDAIIDSSSGVITYPPAVVPTGRYMGVLGSIFRTRDEVPKGTFFVQDHFMYIQDGTHGPVTRAPFHVDLSKAKALLGSDHKLIVRMAMWLNDTGLAAHIELTVSSLVYCFVASD